MLTCCASRGKPAGVVAGKGFGSGKSLFSSDVNSKFMTVTRGVGGVDELAQYLDENSVQWGLISQRVGAGALARTKFIFLYFSGAKCKVVKRMRYTEWRGQAESALGGSGMIEWDRENQDEVNLDALLEKVLHSVVSDSGGADTSVGELRKAALEQIAHASEQVKRIKPSRKVRVAKGGGMLSKLGSSLMSLGSSLSFMSGGPRTALGVRALPHARGRPHASY